MCIYQALKKCKTEEERQATIATYKAMEAAMEAEDDGDAQAWCRMVGEHGSWASHPDYPGMYFCCSCSTAYVDKDQANRELRGETGVNYLELIERANKLCIAATPGPWNIVLGSGVNLCTWVVAEAIVDDKTQTTFIADCLPKDKEAERLAANPHVPNMEFITESRDLVPSLVRALQELHLRDQRAWQTLKDQSDQLIRVYKERNFFLNELLKRDKRAGMTQEQNRKNWEVVVESEVNSGH